MISSQIDSSIGKREFELLYDQGHMEEVWAVMQPRLEEYANNYLEGVSHYKDLSSPGDSFSALLAEMIRKNDKAHDKYFEIFDMELLEEEYAKRIAMLSERLCRANRKPWENGKRSFMAVRVSSCTILFIIC